MIKLSNIKVYKMNIFVNFLYNIKDILNFRCDE